MKFYGLNLRTKEGKLLSAALAILSTSNCKLTIGGREINPSKETPEDLIEMLKAESKAQSKHLKEHIRKNS